uniref:MULE domain-containing protein n=1 Tax=Rhabditophanes sp. KR3021 TaxID=114890 RepID=A0AC35UBG5_9BILA
MVKRLLNEWVVSATQSIEEHFHVDIATGKGRKLIMSDDALSQIKELKNNNMKPKDIFILMSSRKLIPGITQEQLSNKLKTITTDKENPLTTSNELEVALQKLKVDLDSVTDVHQLVCLDYDFEHENNNFTYAISTPFLLRHMNTYINKGIHLDTTYNLDNINSKLTILGCIFDHSFVPIVFFVHRKEDASTFTWMLEQLKKLNVYPEYIMADGCLAITRAYKNVYGDSNVQRLNCFFHVLQNVKKKLKGNHYEATVLSQLKLLSCSPTTSMFNHVVKILIRSWAEINELADFVIYFQNCPILTNDSWSNSGGFPYATNNHVGGYNSALKSINGFIRMTFNDLHNKLSLEI